MTMKNERVVALNSTGKVFCMDAAIFDAELKVLISTAPVYDMYHTEIQMF
jgi:hypothetical protein